MDLFRELVTKAFAVDSVWSVILRGVIWFVIAIVIIISVDIAKPEHAAKNLKANLGFFLVFLILTGGLIYLLFGFAGTPS